MRLYLLVAFLCFLFVLPLSAEEKGSGSEDFVWAGLLADDLFAAGREVNVGGIVQGDAFLVGGDVKASGKIEDSLIAAGGRLKLGADVADDVIVAGGQIEVDGGVGDGLVAAGGAVTIRGSVTGRAIVSGGEIEIARSAAIGRDAWLNGGRIRLDGDVAGDARLRGGEAVINGHIGGNVVARVGTLRIGPEARIDGDVIQRGRAAPDVAKGAVIGGKVTHAPATNTAAWREVARVVGGVLSGVYYLGALLLGLILVLAAPRFVGQTWDSLSGNALTALGVGAVIVFTAPAAMIILMITLIGIPLALGVLSLYMLLFLLSIPFFASAAAHGLAKRAAKGAEPSRRRVVLWLIAVVVALWLIDMIPFAGGLVWLFACMFGIGVASIEVYRALKGSSRAGAPAAE